MKIANLYIRVSADEQADKVTPKETRMKRLRKYCELNSIKVRNVIFEDHSAKTFNRPKWTQYLNEIRKNRGRGADFMIFTKWDRFSRNAGDAYQMIAIFSDDLDDVHKLDTKKLEHDSEKWTK